MKSNYIKMAVSLLAIFTIQNTLGNIVLDTQSDFIVSDLGEGAYITSMQIQDSENILALVRAVNESQIVSYNSVGMVNESFGNHGKMQIPFGGSSVNQSMIIDANKKILVGGFYSGQEQSIKVSRFNVDGSLDRGFGTDGTATMHLPGAGSITKMQIVKGTSVIITGSCNIGGIHHGMLARFTDVGQLDKSFGKDGIIIFDALPGSYFDALQIDKTGRIFVAGHFYEEPYGKLCLICFKENGKIDDSFADQGIMKNGIKSQQIIQVNSLHMLANNKLIVSGQLDNSAFVTCYNAKGKVEKDFGNNGTLFVSFEQRPTLRAAVLDSKENLIIVGSTKQKSFMLKIVPQGLLDSGFGDNGILTESFGKGTHFLAAVLPDQGKLIVGGIASKKPLLMQYHFDNSFVQFNLKDGQILTDLKSISGSASASNAILKLLINDHCLDDVVTDQNGNWHVEFAEPLVNGIHNLCVTLITRHATVATEQSIVVQGVDYLYIDNPIHGNMASETIISGKSSRAHMRISIFIDGIYKHTVFSNDHGKWQSQKIENVNVGDHIISAQLVDAKSAILASAASCITVI